jgi:lycopene beta-cyclase
MKQDVVGLRGFFDGFFRVPLEQWGGFLAGWPGLAYNESHETWFRRIAFGVNFLTKLPPQVALDMTASIIQYSLGTTQLLQSVTPFFGEPQSYEYDRNMDRIGDVAAKAEARKMMQESEVVPEVPVMFDDGETELRDSSSALSPEKHQAKVAEATISETDLAVATMSSE